MVIGSQFKCSSVVTCFNTSWSPPVQVFLIYWKATHPRSTHTHIYLGSVLWLASLRRGRSWSTLSRRHGPSPARFAYSITLRLVSIVRLQHIKHVSLLYQSSKTCVDSRCCNWSNYRLYAVPSLRTVVAESRSVVIKELSIAWFCMLCDILVPVPWPRYVYSCLWRLAWMDTCMNSPEHVLSRLNYVIYVLEPQSGYCTSYI